MLRTSSCDTSDPELQMSPCSPHKQLCNGEYPRLCEKEEDPGNVPVPTKLTLFDKLMLSHNIWLQLGIESAQVRDILRNQPPGTFLMWSNNCGKNKMLTVRLGNGASGCQDFVVKEDAFVLSLEHSYLGFSSLFQMIAYYCVSRDILPFRLQLPAAILHATSQERLEQISALGMMFWESLFNQSQDTTFREVEGDALAVNPTSGLGLLKQQPLPMCSIQVTAENGALFFINPLFLREHGDSWVTKVPPQTQAFGPSCLATKNKTPAWTGCKATPTSPRNQQEAVSANAAETSDSGNSLEEEDAFKGPGLGRDTVSDNDVAALRRKNFTRRAAWSWGEDAESEAPESEDTERERPRPKSTSSETGPGSSCTLPAHYRASWLGAGERGTLPSLTKSHSEASLFTCDSPPLPSISELDSLSISSVEDEGDVTSAAQMQQKRPSSGLSDRVRYRLSAVGHALTGLVSADRRVRYKIEELGQDKGSYFGGLVQGFVSYTRQNRYKYASSTEMLQAIYHMIASLRNYLSQSSELTPILDQTEHEECDIDSSIEKALQKCILKPLRDHIYSCLLEFHTKDGSLGKLRDKQLVLQKQSLADLGITARVPDSTALDKIQGKFNTMHTLYSPWKKVTQLLKACKLIYEAMSGTSGQPHGADDFLPVLTYVLASSNLTNLSLDVEYMMELLDQSQLQGEGGYYLTTMFGALYHISNFQPRQFTRQMSDEAKSSIRQWRTRRTIHYTQSKRRSAQDLLHISLREPSGNQVPILAPAHMSVAEVEKACAEKFDVPDPESYRLFVVQGDSYWPLEGDSCPQKVREELKQKGETAFHFVYGLKDRSQCPQTPSEDRQPTP
ncbi:ras and Rab interactor 2-like [Chiloscyllium punctatum]|uniref:ras and Rab interactor 2-like n=1 Tax=Chiloscyllium punctatum TaxID=137246 RepID=UPI003B63972B